jgi:hypothetical protein
MQADKAEDGRVVGKQGALHMLRRGQDFMLGFFIDGEFAHEADDELCVIGGGGSDL